MNSSGFATREISDENHRNALLDTGDFPLAGLNGAKRSALGRIDIACGHHIARQRARAVRRTRGIRVNKLRGIRMVDQNRIEQGR